MDSHFALASGAKFLPLMVMVNAWPAIAEVGFRLVIVGGGDVIVNAAPDEMPPAVMTVILAVPAVEIRLAETAAVSFVALTYVVFNALLPHLAVEVNVKLLPLIVSVKAAPPAVAKLGLRVVTLGGAANAACATARARVTGKTTINSRRNEHALCI